MRTNRDEKDSKLSFGGTADSVVSGREYYDSDCEEKEEEEKEKENEEEEAKGVVTLGSGRF
ncbi:MAG: hypothetical protein FRX48_06930 [Lasallia pustulata]|uniref:Uncharacterized protein n=1 Tax=Lasallia pustulata TaxID=136370 RepID=A0A5M8PJ51_9LECA|nr:MAG: hypothetical protein FRX48_06930 [Lasallia pustulata]